MKSEHIREKGRSFQEVVLLVAEWWRYLLMKWPVIASGLLFGIVLGSAYAYFKKPTYKAELSFALEDQPADGGLGGALGLASQLGISLGGSGGGAFEGDNLLELFKSKTMIGKALLNEAEVRGRNQALADIYIEFNRLDEKWKDELNLTIRPYTGLRTSELSPLQDSLLEEICEKIIDDDLVVEKKDKKLSIIVVEVNTTNRVFSKHFTEALVKEVSEFYIETKTKKSAYNVSILEHQTDSVRRALNAAIAGVAISEDVNPNPNRAFRTLKVPSQRRQVEVQANLAILEELVKNLEMAKVALRRETPLIQVIDRPASQLRRKKVGFLKGSCLGGILGITLTLVGLTLAYALKEESVNQTAI